MERMRAALARMRKTIQQAQADAAKGQVDAIRQSLAMLAPSAAHAAGDPVRKRFKAAKPISSSTALAMARVAFTAPGRVAAKRQHTFAHRVETTMVDMLAER